MKRYFKQRAFQAITAVIFLVLSVSSCKKFIDIDLPGKNLYAPYIFETNTTLGASLNGVYSAFSSAAGDAFVKPALFADELASSSDLISTQNTYAGSDNPPYSFFANYYKVIYDANYLLEGLAKSNPGLSADTVKLVQGECYFMRALCHFQLTNYYGTPPLVLTTDWQVASYSANSSVDTLYGSIIADLKMAASLLPDNYVPTTPQRVRVNKQAANALLAKAYLYKKDWANAITAATSVIGANSLYKTATTVSGIFDPASKETIWQLWNTTGVTAVGTSFIPSPTSIGTTPASTQLTSALLQSFDTANDLRYKSWVGIQTIGASKYYYAYKYKVRTGTGNEYLVQFRLAEVLLIRAEALAQSNKVSDALADLTDIRSRAGLMPLPANISPAALLDTIAVERKRELAFEGGNRWFDLKRTGKAVQTLLPLKPKFEAYRMLLPYNTNTPGVIGTNPNMKQNDGY